MLGRTHIEIFPGQRVDFTFQCGCGLRKFARQARQDLPVHLDAAGFHAGKHRHHRPLQPFIDGRQAFGRQTRLEDLPQAQGDIGIFRRIGGGLVYLDKIECDQGFAAACNLLEGDWLVAQPALGQGVHALPAKPRIQRIGQQHRIIKALHLDAVALHDQPVVFEILGDLEDRRILKQALQPANGLVHVHLAVRLAAAQQIVHAALVRKRHIGRLNGRAER